MKHRKQKHSNIHQGKLLFNPFPEELKALRESIRKDVHEANRKKIIAHKAQEAEAWDEIKQSCRRLWLLNTLKTAKNMKANSFMSKSNFVTA